jgi:hypothetical protein
MVDPWEYDVVCGPPSTPSKLYLDDNLPNSFDFIKKLCFEIRELYWGNID